MTVSQKEVFTPASSYIIKYKDETKPYSLVEAMQMQPYIRVTDHDVLSGRGVNIAQHAGNERFRALVFSRHDVNYCHAYTTAEKRAIAEEIVAHITSLNPPGRFLRRSGRQSRTVRGLDGPWEELTKDESIKKTCQALRDCNRQDRTGYAASVSIPADVSASKQARSVLGLTNKQLAEIAAAEVKRRDEILAQKKATTTSPYTLHSHNSLPSVAVADPYEPTPINETTSTSNSANLLWLMKQNITDYHAARSTPAPQATPTTSGSSAGYSSSIHEEDHCSSSSHCAEGLHHYSPVATDAMRALLSTHNESATSLQNKETSSRNPQLVSDARDAAHEQDFDDCNDDFSTHFDEDDAIDQMVHHDIHKHTQDHGIDIGYHLSTDASVTAAIERAANSRVADTEHPEVINQHHRHDDFGPPSPLHLHHHPDDDTF